MIIKIKKKRDQRVKCNHLNFKNEIEANQKKYEQLIDDAADEISNFVEKAKLENSLSINCVNKSEIRKKILKIRKKKFDKNFKIINKFISFLKNK
jgi:hypothetical protein